MSISANQQFKRGAGVKVKRPMRSKPPRFGPQWKYVAKRVKVAVKSASYGVGKVLMKRSFETKQLALETYRRMKNFDERKLISKERLLSMSLSSLLLKFTRRNVRNAAQTVATAGSVASWSDFLVDRKRLPRRSPAHPSVRVISPASELLKMSMHEAKLMAPRGKR